MTTRIPPIQCLLTDEALARLRTLASLFLDRKEFTGAGGFVVDGLWAGIGAAVVTGLVSWVAGWFIGEDPKRVPAA